MAEFAGVSSTTMRNRAADIRAALPENARFVADISYRDDVFGNYCYDEIYDECKRTENNDGKGNGCY